MLSPSIELSSCQILQYYYLKKLDNIKILWYFDVRPQGKFRQRSCPICIMTGTLSYHEINQTRREPCMKKMFEWLTSQAAENMYWDLVATVIALGVCLHVWQWLLPFEEGQPVLIRALLIVTILLCWGLEFALKKGIHYLRSRKSKTNEQEE